MIAWEKRPDEPAIWFDRFTRFYLPLGPSRSLLGAYRAYRKEASDSDRMRAVNSVSAGWKENALKYDWRGRADAFDAHERRKNNDKFAELAERTRLEQLQRLRTMQAKLTAKVNTSANLEDLTTF